MNPDLEMKWAGLPADRAPTGLFIDGQWRPSSSGARVEVIDPATELAIASVADGELSDGMDAVAAAYKTADAWAATSPRHRAEILRRAYELMMQRQEPLAQLIAAENGKSMADARGEIAYAAEFFRWYGEEAVRLHGQVGTAPSGGNKMLVRYQPIGVSVLVTPWNFPAAMATRKIAPALAAGCTCVLKPAMETPLTAFAVAQLLSQAGVPDGVLNVVTTTRPGPIVDAMLHDPRVRKLSFTGSTNVGRILLRSAADTIVSCSMELGGNAPFIVFDDADIDAAVEGGMIAKMRNGGQACTAANRFYVQRGIYDVFCERLAQRMSQVKVGPSLSGGNECGPLISQASVDRVTRLVKDALDRGARAIVGGLPTDDRGFFYPPTVLADVAPTSQLLGEEIFGPVAAIMPFDEEDAVCALANATEYGLVSYLYTGNMKRGLRVCERLESGMIGLNRGLVSDAAAPFGGIKQSGLGREGGQHGLHEFSELKYIATEW